jgi:hypothetical protein
VTRYLLALALGMSLLFNVFFAIGFIQARAQRERGDDAAVRLVTEQLRLDEEQEAMYASLRAGMREEADALGGEIELVRAELDQELQRDEPDADRVVAIVQRIAELEGDRRTVGPKCFQDFLTVLDPEQVQRLSRRFPPPRGRHRRGAMERFDLNHDGQLDDEERAAAREHYERRRGEGNKHERWRKEMMGRFDANGDGVLDADEREAMQQWRREHGRERGRGRGGDPGRRPGGGGG